MIEQKRKMKQMTTMRMKLGLTIFGLVMTIGLCAQNYPQNYFRNPLNIPMQLVANFGEIRANHWHMGLDIRTQQRVNLPVYAAAEGYIARVSVEPGGFGQAIYIAHPNGYTTLYGHLNSFTPALAQYVKSQQYEQESWKVNLTLPPTMFPVDKGDLIALSGSTGASQGPHVHFEIRDTKTEKCLNPLLFGFPIADAVPPTVSRIAMYDRNRSTYLQSPQLISAGRTIRTGSNRLGFAIGAVDRFSGTNNPNGIYSARILLDGAPVSGFVLDNIGYDETRYINAQVDLPYKSRGGGDVQQITPLPGARSVAYSFTHPEGVVHLPDEEVHNIVIEVKDTRENTTRRSFSVQYDPALATAPTVINSERFLPNNVNVFEEAGFELFTTEATIYDTVNVVYSSTEKWSAGAVSAQHSFLSPAIPSHDSVTVRIKPTTAITEDQRDHLIVKNVAGTRTFIQRGTLQGGWINAKFRQFGSYQAFVDTEPPTVNAPATNLSRSSSISFTPRDNFNTIRRFRVELDGQWLRFSNNGSRTWSYSFDEHFPRGSHELKVIIEDEAGNVTTKTWQVVR
ncbi:MAG: family metallopeptidase [Flaviaesturariibacter sp.]|nr:family metallopeptidase [Flaviaesturariibacter sp.]